MIESYMLEGRTFDIRTDHKPFGICWEGPFPTGGNAKSPFSCKSQGNQQEKPHLIDPSACWTI